MKNIINLLDKLGSSAELQQLDIATLAKISNPLDLDEQVQKAILNHDNKALEMLLNVRNKVVCAICPAEEEPSDTPQKDDDDQDDAEKAIACNG
ncbi:hypothetical protein MN202_18055 [Rheinheimera muenzenbergensis]|uniref:Uncharacterized protein n=1 Tax=Rheinheimera muenzenbergensis TaxID=1193628 RepID=A0ABU8CC03_9GAMM